MRRKKTASRPSQENQPRLSLLSDERLILTSPEILMKASAAQIDITPAIGGELSGFALRIQPSTGIRDPLFARALYLNEGETRLLWIHCDLIGFDAGIPAKFREWAR